MTTLNLQVGTQEDDAFGASFPFCITGPDASGRWAGGWVIGFAALSGFRYSSVPIPSGATIDSATFKPIPFDSGGSPGEWFTKILGHLVNSSVDFGVSCDISDRIDNFSTVASVHWEPAAWPFGVEQSSPEIKAIIQELVDQPGHASGDPMTVLWTNDGSGNSKFVGAIAFPADPNRAAKMTIDFTVVPPFETLTELDADITLKGDDDAAITL